MRFTTVLGVDKKHLDQLYYSWRTWVKFKKEILENPLVVFFDHTQVTREIVKTVVHDHNDVAIVEWPYKSQPEPKYGTQHGDRWMDPQRYKMLSGFVHVPPDLVSTKYWLKLDTDTIAIDSTPILEEDWFIDDPAIVCQPWGYTKPVDQMDKLDGWAERNLLFNSKPLNLPRGVALVRHKRIISWCGFFATSLSDVCSDLAVKTVGFGKLPVRSQDGYMWYVATRLGLIVRRKNMKARGWKHLSTSKGVRLESEKVLAET